MISQIGYDQIKHDQHSMVTVGTFDGVHRGHQHIIQYLIQRAKRRNLQSVVVTFDPHPREVVTGQPIPLLTTMQERAHVLAKQGLGRMVVIPFTTAFSKMSSDEFVREVLVDRIGISEIVIGYDHGFGHNREGNSQTLKALGAELGFSVHVIPAHTVGKVIVSSTKIRQALESGDVAEAERLLGWYYTLDGTVMQGDQRGRTIGFPTANLEQVHPRKILPKDGVYAVRVLRRSTGETYNAMMNIGRRPTVSDGGRQTLEVHLFNFQGSLYGEILQVAFVARLRNEQSFVSLKALEDQLKRDRDNCVRILKSLS